MTAPGVVDHDIEMTGLREGGVKRLLDGTRIAQVEAYWMKLGHIGKSFQTP